MREAGIYLEDVDVRVGKNLRVKGLTWTIMPGEFWAVMGNNGSGKSVLGGFLAGKIREFTGSVTGLPERIGHVSFEAHTELMDLQKKLDDTDYMDRVDEGTSALDLICGLDGSFGRRKKFQSLGEKERNSSLAKARSLGEKFGLSKLLHRGVRFLSTGEIRKTLICQAMMSDPDLLVLDEPYDGLDAESRVRVADAVAVLSKEGIRVVLVLNRMSEIPGEVTHIALMDDGRMDVSGPRSHVAELIKTFDLLDDPARNGLPGKDPESAVPDLAYGAPLVDMRNVTVSYGGRKVLDDATWKVFSGEHWKISGPNGAGKSTLLSLVSGDNPQSYCNNITLFGMKRGSGESVWDIKKHTGIVSSRFQLDYRVSSTVLGVVASGFFDSIGIYEKPSKLRLEIAMSWLALLGMDNKAKGPFGELSYGEQRMVLIARAMVKHPHVLILDEPCQGLDEINRKRVLKLIDYIGLSGGSTILYVTHHDEDRLSCVNRYLSFVPDEAGEMNIRIG